MRDRERPEEHQHVRRNAGEQQHDVGRDAAEEDIDRVEARRRDPVELLGGMMHRVVLPHRRTVEAAVDPVHHEVGADEEDRRLQPQRQLRQRPVAVVIEFDQAFGGGDAEQEARRR